MAEHRRTSDREVAVAEATGGDGEKNMYQKTNGRLGHEDQVIPDVRASDIEPYTGLRYLSKLFKVMGIVIALLLVAEVATGLSQVGTAAIPTLLGEASRLLVLAGLLWGVGDLALLLIDVGHDVRAGRVLLSRQTYHMVQRGKTESKSIGIAGSTEASRGGTMDASRPLTADRAIPPDAR
jgi:hypothetical protein